MDLTAEAARFEREWDAMLSRLPAMVPDARSRDWLVDVPEFLGEGIYISRFTISERDALVDKMRAAFNPQRNDRSVDAGTYTRLVVDGNIWMTDTPAEVRDLVEVDVRLMDARSCLLVGLGLGVLLRRAIVANGVPRIDVVEIDRRVIDAVGPHYMDLAEKHGVRLTIMEADVHQWRPRKGAEWDVVWLDIWADINDDDLAEVARLRRRFRKRCRWIGAWAQDERLAQKRRIASGKWAY